MYRLSTFEHAEWDRALCIEHLDVRSVLEQGERNFSQVKEAAGLDLDCKDVDSFSLMASRIHAIKTSWAATRSSPVISVTEPSSDEHIPLYDFGMDFSNDDWLKDLLGA